jgi:hypothetical protein
MNFKEWLVSEIATRNRLPSDAVTDKGNMYGIPFGSSRTQAPISAALTGLGGGIGLGVRRAQDRMGVNIRPSPQVEEIPTAVSRKIPNGISLPLQLPALERDDYGNPKYSMTSTSWKTVSSIIQDPENDNRVRKVGEPESSGKFIAPAPGNNSEFGFAMAFTKTLIHIMTLNVWSDEVGSEELSKYDFDNPQTELEHADSNNILTCVFSFKRRDNVPDGIKRQNFEND